jgi:hypothetical protein
MALRLSGDGDLEILDTTLTNVTASNLSASVVSASGTVTLPSTTSIGAVSSTELGFVDGVTSAIQTQLGSRVLTTGGSTITAANASTVGVTVKGAASQTADLIRARNSSDTDLFRVEDDGLISGSGPSLGAWTSFTPTLTASITNPTLGTASTSSGAYCQIGKIVHYRLLIKFGTSGVNVGSGFYFITVPVTMSSAVPGFTPVGNVFLDDASTSKRVIGIAIRDSNTAFSMQVQSDSVGTQVVSDSTPWTWAANDAFIISGTYQAA